MIFNYISSLVFFLTLSECLTLHLLRLPLKLLILLFFGYFLVLDLFPSYLSSSYKLRMSFIIIFVNEQSLIIFIIIMKGMESIVKDLEKVGDQSFLVSLDSWFRKLLLSSFHQFITTWVIVVKLNSYYLSFGINYFFFLFYLF